MHLLLYWWIPSIPAPLGGLIESPGTLVVTAALLPLSFLLLINVKGLKCAAAVGTVCLHKINKITESGVRPPCSGQEMIEAVESPAETDEPVFS